MDGKKHIIEDSDDDSEFDLEEKENLKMYPVVENEIPRVELEVINDIESMLNEPDHDEDMND